MLLTTYMLVPRGVIVTIEVDEDGWFIAWAHDLPGCVAQGRSLDEAMQNIAGSVEDAIEVLREDQQSEATVSDGAGPSIESFSAEAEIRIPTLAA